MMRRLCLIAWLSVAAAQTMNDRIVAIDFYGYAGLDRERLRAALPVREGDRLDVEHPPQFSDEFDKASGKRDYSMNMVYAPDVKGWVM